jgi:putative transcriptional regulator
MKTRLRVLRAEKEWSQAELAAHVGVARGNINAIETGKYDPSLPLAFKIARALGKNVEEVFLYSEEQDQAPPCEDDFTQPENHGAVVCRALTNRKETPFLAQLLSLKSSGPLETPFQASLIVG